MGNQQRRTLQSQMSCLSLRAKPHGIAQQDTQVRLSAAAIMPLGGLVAAADAIATGAMILGFCKTAQTWLQYSCLPQRPKPPGTAQRGTQVQLSAVAITPLGGRVAAADVIATGATILGFCKTSQIPMQCSYLPRRPKPRGIAQQGMQAQLSAVAVTPLGGLVAAADAIATGAAILGFFKTSQIPMQCSYLPRRPKPRGIAQRGTQVQLSAVAVTP